MTQNLRALTDIMLEQNLLVALAGLASSHLQPITHLPIPIAQRHQRSADRRLNLRQPIHVLHNL